MTEKEKNDKPNIRASGQNDIELKQFVIFQLGNEEYGIPIQQVRSIEKVPGITTVPHMPEFLVGIINLRGNLIPVIDIGKRFGVPIKEDEENRIIVSKPIEGQTYGAFVSSVSEIQKVPSNTIGELPDSMTKIGKEYLTGVVKTNDRLFILLDMAAILSDTEKSAMAGLNLDDKTT